MRFSLRSPYLWMGLGIAVIVTLQMTAPKPISWEYTYESDDKNPFGGWIPAHYLDRTFEGEMRSLRNVMWSESGSAADKPTSNDAYVIVTHSFSPDTEAQRMMLDVVREGGTLFIAADEIGDSLASAVGIKARSGTIADTITFRVGTSLQSYAMGGFDYANTFTPIDTNPRAAIDASTASVDASTPSVDASTASVDASASLTDTGAASINSNAWKPLAYVDTSVTLTRRAYGRGSIILCGTPDLLTNKAFLDSASRPIPVTILSTLPDKPIVWDEYYKPKRSVEMTVNRAIGSIPGLSLAYWLLICTGIVYLIMAGRRRQRPIPIIHPVRNTSLDFVSTVGRLYYGRHDNLNLANKLSRLFRDHVVNRLRLRVDVDAQTLAESISNASGADVALVSNILRRMSHADSGFEFSDADTVAFHNDIQTFQQQSTI